MKPDDAILRAAAHDEALRRASWRSTTCRSTSSAGSITALIGPNGAGKTTLFNCSPASSRRRRATVVVRRRAHRRPAAASSLTARAGADVPDPARLPPADGARKYAGRRPGPTRRALLRLLLSVTAPWCGASARRARRRASCWRCLTSSGSPTSMPAPCPAGSASSSSSAAC